MPTADLMLFRTRREASDHIATLLGWPDARPVHLTPGRSAHWDANGSGDLHEQNDDGRYPDGCHCLAPEAYETRQWAIAVDRPAMRYLHADGYVR